MAAPPTVPESFRKAVRFLEENRVPFVVVGGIAVGLQGEPRYTRDVDFMILLKSGDIHRLALLAQSAGFDIDPSLAETQWHFSGFVRLWLGEPGMQTAVDLMACTNDFLREAAFRAQQSRFAGLTVPIATPEDMILFKLAAWRTKDIPDAQAIRLRHADRLDLPYLRRWASWMVERNPRFRDVPARLEALLAGGPLPPANPDRE
jgi:hypothetical protein